MRLECIEIGASSSRCSAARRQRGRSRRARSSRRSCRPSGSWARTRLRPRANGVAAFVQRLRELGWIEGRNVAIEYRWAEGRSERFAEIAAEFVRLKVDVIVTAGTAASSRQSRRHRSSRSCSRPRATRSAPAWSRVWRDRAATSPACRASDRYLPASNSNFCARLFPVSAGWRSWPMSAIPTPCWKSARFRQRPARSASKSPHSKSGAPRISLPPSRRSRAAQRRYMSAPIRS